MLDALEAAPAGLSVPELLARVNLSKGGSRRRIAAALAGVAGADRQAGIEVAADGSEPERGVLAASGATHHPATTEQRQMQEYVSLTSGHMEFLIRALDGNGHDIPALALAAAAGDGRPGLVREAVAFLRRTSLPIEPRKQWPAGGLPQYRLTGRIPPELQAQPGKALCVWGDAGWGDLVRRGKYRDGASPTSW